MEDAKVPTRRLLDSHADHVLRLITGVVGSHGLRSVCEPEF